MDDNRKKRITDAMNKFIAKDAREIDKLSGVIKSRKNKSPEKEVETECLAWMRQRSWVVQIYESKSTYDPVRGIYRQQSMRAGNADCQGTMPGGISVAVEFKAKGKLSSFCREGNDRQVNYIIERINIGSFACVVDSVRRLEAIFCEWERQRLVDPELAIKFLIDALPAGINKKAKDLIF